MVFVRTRPMVFDAEEEDGGKARDQLRTAKSQLASYGVT